MDQRWIRFHIIYDTIEHLVSKIHILNIELSTYPQTTSKQWITIIPQK